MFFVLRSAEVLFNKKLHSKIALFVVGIIGVQLLLVPVEFSAKGFYVEHQSTFFWAAAWMLLFIYWNVAVLKNLRTVNEQSRKVAIYYLFAVLNTSFILSAIYTLYGYAYLSVNVCHDSPSIWCTFFVIQAIILPFFLASFDRSFRRPEKQGFGNKEFLILLCVSLFIIVMLVFTLPFFDCLSWKFIFP